MNNTTLSLHRRTATAALTIAIFDADTAPWSEVLKALESHLMGKGRAILTVRNYLSDLRMFGAWFEQRNAQGVSLALITPIDVREYRDALLSKRLSPATINRRLIALQVLSQWARQVGLIEFDPTEDVRSVPRQKMAPRWLDRTEQNALLRRAQREMNNAPTAAKQLQAQRDLAILLLLLNTGLRVNELCSLTADDVAISERKGVLTVRLGKGLKWRDVPLNAPAFAALKSWREVRRQANHSFIFTGARQEPLHPRGIQHRISELGRLAGLEGVTPHTLRHTFAKNLIDAGVTIDKVALLLGHSSLNTTRIYTMPSALDLEQAVALVGD